jgi:hypothetical protein
VIQKPALHADAIEKPQLHAAVNRSGPTPRWAPNPSTGFTAPPSEWRPSRPQPSPTLGDALNAGYTYLEVRCLGCDTHQTVALDIVRRPKTTPIHELERYMRCKDCSEVRGYPYKRSHLVALRRTKISVSDPQSHWWRGES